MPTAAAPRATRDRATPATCLSVTMSRLTRPYHAPAATVTAPPRTAATVLRLMAAPPTEPNPGAPGFGELTRSTSLLPPSAEASSAAGCRRNDTTSSPGVPWVGGITRSSWGSDCEPEPPDRRVRGGGAVAWIDVIERLAG